MTLFLILAPFATFAALMMLTSIKITLAASALGVLGWDAAKGRSTKALAAGALAIFSTLLGYHLLSETAMSPTHVRLAGHRAGLTGHTLSFHASICPRSGRA